MPAPVRVPLDARTETMFPGPMRGRIVVHRFSSRALEGNPWGDPTERELPVYLPPSGVTEGAPLLVLLSGYTGAGYLHFARPRYLSDSIVGRLDRLIRTGSTPEAVLVGPDCVTTLGGSQYRDSSATGRYAQYVVREIVPWVRDTYRTGPTAVLGTSSGGYGALTLAMRYPDVFRAAASNAGDAYFEYCYAPEFPTAVREIRAAGGPEALLRRLLSEPLSGFGPSHPMVKGLEMMAYASCYSPRDDAPGEFDLPFDLDSGALRPDVWDRWLACDPVRLVEQEPYRSAARGLACLYVDGGGRDEFGLDVSARVFASRARAAGVRVDLQTFDAGHFDSGPRYDVMIPRLVKAVTAGGSPGAGV